MSSALAMISGRLLSLLPLLLLAAASMQAAKIHSEHSSSDSRVHKMDLSEHEHDERPGMDDHKYDHDAFLGHDEALKFDKMTPEQSKEALAKVVAKIDADANGYVSRQELSNWIELIAKRHVLEDSERQFRQYPGSNSSQSGIQWEEYKSRMFGDAPADHAAATLQRERRRWQRADLDGDDRLNVTEFAAFAHPEDSPHMRDLIGQETIEDLDKNKDGFIDENEFVSEMWTGAESGEQEEPEWVKSERESFRAQRDLNKDGRLDLKEVMAWILPDDHDHVHAETRHLFEQADTDKDGQLSLDEILANHELFAGSQATNYGEELRHHHEL